jgi:hypothetical protein
LIAAGLLLVGGLVACGKDDSSSKKSATNPEAPDPTVFDVEIDMSTGAGPVPLKVAYKSRVANAKGKVTYKWTFDEGGATSTEANPTFTYSKTGWKLAKVVAKDEGGHTSNALQPIRVWPVAVWNGVTSGKYSPQKSQAILVANLQAYERKTGGKIAGISAAPLPGQKALTPESRAAQRRQPLLERRAQLRANRAAARKLREAKRKKRQQQNNGN